MLEKLLDPYYFTKSNDQVHRLEVIRGIENELSEKIEKKEYDREFEVLKLVYSSICL